MDEIEFLVDETFKHYQKNFGGALSFEDMPPHSHAGHGVEFREENELPLGSGLIYHVQKSTSVFVVRTFVSKNIRNDFLDIIENPENYPSLRLLDGSLGEVSTKLKYFLVDESSLAEIIHDQVHNRRFPIHEEMICNLSDPGFSWWLSMKPKGFQLAFTMSMTDEHTIKLGPLGDRELAVRNFQMLEELISNAGIPMNIQNELNRVQFTDCEEFILEELKDIFEFGVITDTLRDLFKILASKIKKNSSIETSWLYLQEVAAMRRFWIQVQYDLNL